MGIGYSVIINYITTFLTFYLPSMHILSPRKGSRYRNWAILSSIYFLWVMLSRFVLDFSSIIYLLSGNIALALILFKYFYRDSWKRCLMAVMIVFVIGLLSDWLSILLIGGIIPAVANMYFHVWLGDMANQVLLIGNICFEMVYVTMVSSYFCLVQKREIKLFLAFMLFPVYQLILVTGFCILCYNFTEGVAWTGLIIGIFSFVIDVLSLHFLNSILQKQDIETQIKSLEETRRQEYDYFCAVSCGMEELRMMRHDFSNQLQAVYKMADGCGDMDMAREMVEKMSSHIRQQGTDG